MRQFTHTTSRSFQPLITVAEGRSRRQLNKVDYNFQDYDEQIFEAMDETSSQSKQILQLNTYMKFSIWLHYYCHNNSFYDFRRWY